MNRKKIISIIIILTLVVVCTILPVFAQITIYLEVDNVLYQTPGSIQGYKVSDWRILNYSGQQVTWDLEGYYEYANWGTLIDYGYTRFRCDTSGRFTFRHTGYHWEYSTPSNKTLDTDLEDEWSYPCGTPGALKNAGKTNNNGELYGNVVFHFFVIEGGDDDDVSDVIDWFVDNDVSMEPMDPDASIEAYRNLKIQISFNNRIRPFKFGVLEGYDYKFRLNISEGNDSIHFNTSVEPNEKNFGVLAQYIDYSSLTKTTQSYTSYTYYHPVTGASGTIVNNVNISMSIYHFDLVFIPNGNYTIDWQYLGNEYIFCSYSVNDNYNYANWFSRRCNDYANGVISFEKLTTFYNSVLLKYSSGSVDYNNIITSYNSVKPTAPVLPSFDPQVALDDTVDNLNTTILLGQNYGGDYFGSGKIFANIIQSSVVWQMLSVMMPVVTVAYILFGKRIH